MKSIHASDSGVVAAIAVSAIALSLVMPLRAQDAAAHRGIAKDWITHHVVFSNPGTRAQAIQNGAYDRWLRIVSDPRYIMQQEERSLMASAPSGTAWEADTDDGPASDSQAPAPRAPAYRGPLPRGLREAVIPPPAELAAMPAKLGNHHRLKKDWSEGLSNTSGSAGVAGATTGLGEFPATYTTGGTSSSDFAIYNTGLAGAAGQPSIIAYNNLYTTSPSVTWAYNTGGTIVNSVAFYNQTGQTGTQVYFVQNNSSNQAQLVLLKWAAGSGTLASPTTLTAVATTAYPTCTASCMTTITLSGTPSDTYSSPYYDAFTDTIYVGDDGGKLHKFHPVFSGTSSGNPPVEVTTSPWPVAVNTNASLGSPVYDGGSGNVFVGDYPFNFASACQPPTTSTNSPCGYLYSVVASSGSFTKSAQLDYNDGIIDSPIVDSSAGYVYAFVGDDGSTACAVPGSSTNGPCAGVFRFATSSVSTSTEARVGAGYEFMMSGTFDNAYFNTGTGHLYVVGNTGPADNTLYQIAISPSGFGTITAGPEVANNYDNGYYAAGLQVTEYLNGSADYVFLGVLAFGNVSVSSGSGCTGPTILNGCVMGFNVTTGSISSGTAATGALPEAGGTSGIVVDYAPGTSGNIYFSTLLNSSCTTPSVTAGCAIQTQQAVP